MIGMIERGNGRWSGCVGTPDNKSLEESNRFRGKGSEMIQAIIDNQVFRDYRAPRVPEAFYGLKCSGWKSRGDEKESIHVVIHVVVRLGDWGPVGQ